MAKTPTHPGKSVELDAIGTLLVHAAQILLFAPVEWNCNIEYSPVPSSYDHRFPFSFGGVVDKTIFGGRFSTEDINRAVLLVYYNQARRNLRGNWLSARAPTNTKFLWTGYLDPEYKADQKKGKTRTDVVANRHAKENLDLAVRQAKVLKEVGEKKKAHARAIEDVEIEGSTPLLAPETAEPVSGMAAFELGELAMQAMQTTNLRKIRATVHIYYLQDVIRGSVVAGSDQIFLILIRSMGRLDSIIDLIGGILQEGWATKIDIYSESADLMDVWMAHDEKGKQGNS
ncbi:hypothetical protein BKA56DRAFT_667277 [Ilyonectria sp. MPI-CAGE-AT-0026]|nr:hypothetical protein BKA56DRAFT_667277 [Ilyonectria sp. MPI-CAGE-AT-0026]